MRFLIVITLFACVLFCANAQFNVLQSIGDKIPLPDEVKDLIEEGTDEPDTDEPATEGYEDGDDENDLVDEEDDLDEDDDEDEMDLEDEDDNESIGDIDDDEDDDINEDDDDDDDIDEDDDGIDQDDDDDDEDDDEDEDDGVYRYDHGRRHHHRGIHHHRRGHHHRGRGPCVMRCRKVAMECRKKGGERRQCYRAFVMCMKKCSGGRGPHPFPPGPKFMRCGKKCFVSLIDCMMGNSTRGVCMKKLRDCLQDCRKNCSRNSTFPLRDCLKNCTEKLLDCLENGNTSSFVCMKQMAVCTMKCKKRIDPRPRNHTVNPGYQLCSEKCKKQMFECTRSLPQRSSLCRNWAMTCFAQCKRAKPTRPTRPVRTRGYQRFVTACVKDCAAEAYACYRSGSWRCGINRLRCMANCSKSRLSSTPVVKRLPLPNVKLPSYRGALKRYQQRVRPMMQQFKKNTFGKFPRRNRFGSRRQNWSG